MPYYKIYAGLGGGFGGSRYQDTLEYKSKEEAEEDACRIAREEYDNYAGMYGLRDIDDIMAEEECDQDSAEEIYNDEREGWLSYKAVEANGPDDIED